jgi:hypothetical protein
MHAKSKSGLHGNSLDVSGLHADSHDSMQLENSVYVEISEFE